MNIAFNVVIRWNLTGEPDAGMLMPDIANNFVNRNNSVLAEPVARLYPASAQMENRNERHDIRYRRKPDIACFC